jgi:hypothetical protein
MSVTSEASQAAFCFVAVLEPYSKGQRRVRFDGPFCVAL